MKIGSRYGLMTRQEVALIKAEEEEKGKKKGKKSARGSRSPKRSAKTREKSASPDKKDDKGNGHRFSVLIRLSTNLAVTVTPGVLTVFSLEGGGRGIFPLLVV